MARNGGRAPQLAALSLLVLVAGCEAIPHATGDGAPDAVEAPSPQVDGDGSLQQHADAHTAAFVAEESGGAIVFVARGDESATATAGTASSAGDALTIDTPMRVGSLTKPFVATMVLQLVDEGQVELDAPLARYLPGAQIGGDRTVRQLLSHRSGLPNYTDHPDFAADVIADRQVAFDVDQVLAYASSETMPAGEAFHYSNTNYLLLGRIIEQLDDRTLAGSLAARITDPLGLTATRLDDGPGDVADVAGGWSPGILDGEVAAPYVSIATSAWAAGALVSSAPDLAAFLDALFDGRLLPKDLLEEMTDTGAEGYGLGLAAVGFGGDARGFGHSGATPGYSATMGIDPSAGDRIVVLTNNDSLSADQLVQAILLGPGFGADR